jgi:hypothetical protein
MDNKTIVVFRKFKDRGDIVALFPAEINYPNGNCESYQRVGQHGAANYNHCMKISVAAKPEEYKSLKIELESVVGYDLKVMKRYSRK